MMYKLYALFYLGDKMFKEKGYDEYVAQKIKQGRDDIAQGRTCSLEEANAEWQEVIAKFAQDEKNFEQEVMYA